MIVCGEVMKVLSIIDSFKGTITSNELGIIISKVLRRKQIEADYLPISDGGDGFLDAIEKAVATNRVMVRVLDPLGRQIETYYLYDDVNKIAYVELAKSSGINLLTKDELNPFRTSTYGLGQVINHIIDAGVKNIIVGIGGSATNDGGAGMLEAMGCLFYDNNNHLLTRLTGGNLDLVSRIDPLKLYQRTKDVQFMVLSDVTNPLLYENGATYVFSIQKGAKKEELQTLDTKMKKYAMVIEEHLQKKYYNATGAGAAGGVGFAFHSLLKAEFYSGIDYILDLVDFNNIIMDYDYIITGEGKIDSQSLDGKVVFGISQRAQGKKIILVCAINEIEQSELSKRNIYQIYSVVDKIATKEESMKYPKECFQRLCESIDL